MRLLVRIAFAGRGGFTTAGARRGCGCVSNCMQNTLFSRSASRRSINDIHGTSCRLLDVVIMDLCSIGNRIGGLERRYWGQGGYWNRGTLLVSLHKLLC